MAFRIATICLIGMIFACCFYEHSLAEVADGMLAIDANGNLNINASSQGSVFIGGVNLTAVLINFADMSTKLVALEERDTALEASNALYLSTISALNSSLEATKSENSELQASLSITQSSLLSSQSTSISQSTTLRSVMAELNTQQASLSTSASSTTAMVAALSSQEASLSSAQAALNSSISTQLSSVSSTQLVFASSLAVTATIVPYAGSSIPGGWLTCDGRVLAIASYPALFLAIGATYGGDGVKNFKLPDLRGRTVIGTSGSHPLGAAVGEETHILTQAEMPAHAHAATDSGHSHSGTTTQEVLQNSGFLGIYYYVNIPGSEYLPTSASGNNQIDTGPTLTAHVHQFTTNSASANINIQPTGSGAPHNNMQPSMPLNYIIKT